MATSETERKKRDPLEIIVPLVVVVWLAEFARAAYAGSGGIALRVLWLCMAVQLLAIPLRSRKPLYWFVTAPSYIVGLIALIMWIRQ